MSICWFLCPRRSLTLQNAVPVVGTSDHQPQLLGAGSEAVTRVRNNAGRCAAESARVSSGQCFWITLPLLECNGSFIRYSFMLHPTRHPVCALATALSMSLASMLMHADTLDNFFLSRIARSDDGP